jgi:prolyl 4-hydroxylase
MQTHEECAGGSICGHAGTNNPMQKITVLTNDWKRWLDENRHLGCSEASMIASMIKAHVDPAVARQWVRDVSGEAPVATAPAHALPVHRSDAVTRGYVYDTVRLPAAGNLVHASGHAVRVTLRMARPVLAVFDNLLSAPECDELIRLSSIKLRRSTIVDPQTGEQRFIDDRSSDGTYFLLNENEFIASIDRRISELLCWPVENGEGLQILRYGKGGEYKPHFDYFDPSSPGSAAHVAKGGQRVSTLIIYLSDVEQAGETFFPSIGITVVPKKGSAVYFEYCNSLGQVDASTLHGGMPVRAGEKWIATKWMRERRYA